ncbi:MAG: molybdopterin biosynthesis protein, partial [bacterium]
MERKRRVFRHLKTVEEAKGVFFGRFGGALVGTETVSVREALGRVVSAPVRAAISVPSYHAAAMDGIAVRASDTFGALPEKPVLLGKGAAPMIDTGAPMPEGTDAVVMIEKVEDRGDAWEVREAAYPWRNVRKVGEDIVKGEIVTPPRTRIRPWDQCALLAAGVTALEVFRKPRVVIVPTGEEMAPPGETPMPPPP